MKFDRCGMCNICEFDGCNKYKKEDIIIRCGNFISQELFCMPILTHLLTSNPNRVQKTKEVLEEFGLIVEESEEYPYFKTLIKRVRG